jgi:hypothetical protein
MRSALVVVMLAASSAAMAQASLTQTPLTGAPASPFVSGSPGDVLATNLIELEVKNPQGDRIGEIEDVVLDAGRLMRAVVIGIGGYRGGNTRHIAVTPDALQVSRDAAGHWQAVLTATPEALKSAPDFNYKSGFNEE